MKIITNYRDALSISLILILCFAFAAGLGAHRHGDASSYYLMAASIAKDRDLIIDNRDIFRWEKYKFEDVPAGLYALVAQDGSLRYAKPILYPLLASPFVFLGPVGFSVFNGLLLAGSIIFCYLFLRKYLAVLGSFSVAGLFFFCSFMPVYTGWIHPEMMSFFFCCLCLWLWLAKDKIIITALIIGIVGSNRALFLLLLLPLIVDLVWNKKYKKVALAIAACGIGFTIMSVITLVFLKQVMPYAGTRGYLPAGKICSTLEGLKKSLVFFNNSGQLSFRIGFDNLKLFVVNFLNFFIGRSTGLIWYLFPGIVCGIMYIIFRGGISESEKVKGDAILLVVPLAVVTLIISKPLNYFGGGDFICNRYFFLAPALIFLPTVKIFKKKPWCLLFFLPGFLVSLPILINGLYGIKKVGAHTLTFPLKYAPLEIAQSATTFCSQFTPWKNVSIYIPLNMQVNQDKEFFLNKGQELIIKTKIFTDSIGLETDYGQFILRPRISIKDTKGREFTTFFYYQAQNRILIKDAIIVYCSQK